MLNCFFSIVERKVFQPAMSHERRDSIGYGFLSNSLTCLQYASYLFYWRRLSFYNFIGPYPAQPVDHCVSPDHSAHRDMAERSDLTVMIDQDSEIDDCPLSQLHIPADDSFRLDDTAGKYLSVRTDSCLKKRRLSEPVHIVIYFFKNCCHPVRCSVSIGVQGKTPGQTIKNDAYKAGGIKK